MKTFQYDAFRYERYVASGTIEATDEKDAMQQLIDMDENGDLDFMNYTGESQETDHLNIWHGETDLHFIRPVVDDPILSLLQECEAVLCGRLQGADLLNKIRYYTAPDAMEWKNEE